MLDLLLLNHSSHVQVEEVSIKHSLCNARNQGNDIQMIFLKTKI